MEHIPHYRYKQLMILYLSWIIFVGKSKGLRKMFLFSHILSYIIEKKCIFVADTYRKSGNL